MRRTQKLATLVGALLAALAVTAVSLGVTRAAPSTRLETGESVGKSFTSNEVGSPATSRSGSKTTPGRIRRPHRVVRAKPLPAPAGGQAAAAADPEEEGFPGAGGKGGPGAGRVRPAGGDQFGKGQRKVKAHGILPLRAVGRTPAVRGPPRGGGEAPGRCVGK